MAVYISGSSPDESLSLKIGKRSLLRVILIGICIVTILSNIAEILLYLFEAFKEGAGRRNPYDDDMKKVSKDVFTIAAIRTIVAFVILYFSKEISGWFIRKNEADELIFDSNPEN
jgi:ABC-type enterochelin transport system permease subunit